MTPESDTRPDETEDRQAALPEGRTEQLSTSDAADRAGVTTRQVVRWLNAGKLKGEKLDGTWSVDAEAFEDFLGDRLKTEARSPSAVRPVGPSESVLVSGLKSELAEARQRVSQTHAEAVAARGERNDAKDLAEWLKTRLEAAEKDRERLLLALPSPDEVEANQAERERRAQEAGALKQQLATEAAGREAAEIAKAEEHERAEKIRRRALELKTELEAERSKSWLARVFGK